MIIKAEAMSGKEFHSSVWKYADGSCQRWRANGACKTWVTREREFRLPVKYGLRAYGYITHQNANEYHMPDECHLQYRSDKTGIPPLPWYYDTDGKMLNRTELSIMNDYLNKWADHVYDSSMFLRPASDDRELAREYVEDLEDLASEVYKLIK